MYHEEALMSQRNVRGDGCLVRLSRRTRGRPMRGSLVLVSRILYGTESVTQKTRNAFSRFGTFRFFGSIVKVLDGARPVLPCPQDLMKIS